MKVSPLKKHMLKFLSPWLQEVVKDRYNVIETGWVSVELWGNLDQLEERIKVSRKVKYDSNDRYIIFHEEMDYYLADWPYGLWMNRLLNIFMDHDIPLWTLILIVGTPNTGEEIERIVPKRLLNYNQPTVLSKWSTLHHSKSTEPDKVELNVDDIQKPMVAMMGRSRLTRQILYQHVKNKNLFDRIAISYSGRDPRETSRNRDYRATVAHSTSVKILPVPPDTSRDNWNRSGVFSIGNLEPYRDPIFDNIPYGVGAQDAGFNPYGRYFEPEYRKFALDIVTETEFDYPYPFFTEKILRPLASKRMFIVAGPCGLLAHLKDLGFKTFGSFIDESYDSITDPSDRMLAVLEEVDRLSSIPLDKFKEKMLEYSSVLDHNQKHIEVFKKQAQEKDKNCLN